MPSEPDGSGDESLDVPFDGSERLNLIANRDHTELEPEWSPWYFIGVDAAINGVNQTNAGNAATGGWRIHLESVMWLEEGDGTFDEDPVTGSASQENIETGTEEQNPDFNETSTGDDATCKWERFQDYYIWACRGTLYEITQRVQDAFGFEPPVTEASVGSRLNGDNAAKQMAFLQANLPGERHSMERAIERVILHAVEASDCDVWAGRQELDTHQLDDSSADYPQPPLPPNAPEQWSRQDDAVLHTFVGSRPETFVSDYGQMYFADLDVEFVAIRMAQTLHLDISPSEIAQARGARQQLQLTIQSNDTIHHDSK